MNEETSYNSELLTEPINIAIKHHQATATDWVFASLTVGLHHWAERIIFDFKFEIGIPALMVEPLRRKYGHYRGKRNGFGLIDEIAIGKEHVENSQYWQVIGTLCHELVHAWQQYHGTPPSPRSHNYHNSEFRDKAKSIGLIVDQRGFTQYEPGNTLFFKLLRKYGINTPNIPRPQLVQSRKGQSTLKLYQCLCGVKVRVGRSKFNAKCLDCGSLFKKKI